MGYTMFNYYSSMNNKHKTSTRQHIWLQAREKFLRAFYAISQCTRPLRNGFNIGPRYLRSSVRILEWDRFLSFVGGNITLACLKIPIPRDRLCLTLIFAKNIAKMSRNPSRSTRATTKWLSPPLLSSNKTFHTTLTRCSGFTTASLDVHLPRAGMESKCFLLHSH